MWNCATQANCDLVAALIFSCILCHPITFNGNAKIYIFMVPTDPICWLIFHILDSVSFVHGVFVVAWFYDFFYLSWFNACVVHPIFIMTSSQHSFIWNEKKLTKYAHLIQHTKDNHKRLIVKCHNCFYFYSYIIAVINSPKISGVDFGS